MAQRALDLAGEQLTVVAEVPFEGVAVDDDPVLVAVVGDAVAEVLAIGVLLGAELGDHDRHLFEHPLELLRQGVDRVRHEGFELVHLESVHDMHYVRRPGAAAPATQQTHEGECQRMREVHSPVAARLRIAGVVLAALALLAGGIVWSGCGSSSDNTSSDTTGNVQESLEEGVKKAEKGLEEGSEAAKKGLEKAKEELKGSKGSAKKGIEEGVEKAEKGLEEGRAQAEKGVEEAKQQAEKYTP